MGETGTIYKQQLVFVNNYGQNTQQKVTFANFVINVAKNSNLEVRLSTKLIFNLVLTFF